jgi:tetratricopeptide (TPR) repeat protein
MILGGFRSLRPGVAPLAGHRATRERLRTYLLLIVARSTIVRGSIWRLTRLIGATVRWATSSWRRLILGLVVLGLVIVALNTLIAGKLKWPSIGALLALYVLIAFLLTLWRARNRVVVERFVDYSQTDDKDEPRIAHGLSAMLVAKLTELRELYEEVDESRAISTAVQSTQPIQATVQLEDVTEFLQNAATADSKVSVGPLVLPVGTILALFGRMVQGPRLVGGLSILHRAGDGQGQVAFARLTVQYTGKRLLSWTVEQELAPAGSNGNQPPELDSMVDELACRMFASLALGSSVNWRAAHKFLDGLRTYRDCLQTQRDRALQLRRAERLFVEALALDERLPFAYYNLGVVYTDLRALVDESEKPIHFSAAEMAFRREIELAPDRWEPHYALAQTFFDQGRYGDVTAPCDRVLALSPSAVRLAEAHDLKGLAEGKLDLPEDLAVRRASVSRRRAVAYSWLALLACELSDPARTGRRGLASRCALNLAVAAAIRRAELGRSTVPRRLWSYGAFRRIRRLLRHASALNGADARPLNELGILAASSGRLPMAIRALKAATRIEPTNGRYWANLAMTDALLVDLARGRKPERAAEWEHLARAACARALDAVDCRTPDAESEETLDAVASTFSRLGDEAEADHVRNRLTFHAFLDAPGTTESELLAELDRVSKLELEWETGATAFALGIRKLGAGASADAHNHFVQARNWFGRSYPEEIRRRGVMGLIARALSDQESYDAALPAAAEAIGLDPLSPFEREILGEIFERMKDYERASEAWESALLWQQNSASLHRKLGNCHWLLAKESPNPDARNRALRRAILHFESALDLYGHEQLRERRMTHYWLARLRSQLGEWERLIPHLRIALTAEEEAPLVNLLLAEAHLERKNFVLAETNLHEAREAAKSCIAHKGFEYELGSSFDDWGWPAGLVLAWVHRTFARLFVSLDVRLDEARDHVGKGLQLLDYLGGTSQGRRSCRADLHQLDGRIFLRAGDFDLAVAALERSLALSPDCEAYLYLGRAYNAQAGTTRTKRSRKLLLERVRAACAHSRDLDSRLQFSAEVDALLARLDGRESTPEAAQSDGLVATAGAAKE